MKRSIHILWLIAGNTIVLTIVMVICLVGNKAVNTAVESVVFGSGKLVIIDAGHGGIDGGATSCTGVLESAINLEIALRLDDLLHLIGIPTQMIRSTDRSVYTEGETIAAQKISDLKNRVKMINSTANAIVISIHQNYFSSSKYRGAQTFYGVSEGSKSLAQTLQSKLVSTINVGSTRKAKKANGIYLMEHIQSPGVLLECGFLSNPEEEALLRSSRYQKNLCCVIATVCSDYLQQHMLS